MKEAVEFMQRYNFATIVTASLHTNIRPEATHVPFVIQCHGDSIRLLSHIAKANPQWKDFTAGQQTLVMFHEPHAYVSTTFYDSNDEVPTWNYTAVHCYGTPRIITARAEGFALLEAMMDTFEPRYREQWNTLGDTFRNGLYNGIVPFEMEVVELQFKKKLSQNKTSAERTRIKAAFEGNPDPLIAETGRMIRI